jgi:hypothetical protein
MDNKFEQLEKDIKNLEEKQVWPAWKGWAVVLHVLVEVGWRLAGQRKLTATICGRRGGKKRKAGGGLPGSAHGASSWSGVVHSAGGAGAASKAVTNPGA